MGEQSKSKLYTVQRNTTLEPRLIRSYYDSEIASVLIKTIVVKTSCASKSKSKQGTGQRNTTLEPRLIRSYYDSEGPVSKSKQ